MTTRILLALLALCLLVSWPGSASAYAAYHIRRDKDGCGAPNIEHPVFMLPSAGFVPTFGVIWTDGEWVTPYRPDETEPGTEYVLVSWACDLDPAQVVARLGELSMRVATERELLLYINQAAQPIEDVPLVALGSWTPTEDARASTRDERSVLVLMWMRESKLYRPSTVPLLSGWRAGARFLAVRVKDAKP